MPIKKDDTKAILENIAINGLIPASRLHDKLISLAADGERLNHVCFNLLDLDSHDRHTIAESIRLLRDHDNVGITDISLERQKLTIFNSEESFTDEVQERLLSTILFICRIPKDAQEYKKEIYISDCINSAAFHEVRSTKGIGSSDILAVCVPEYLMDLAREVFKHHTLIPVTSIKGTLGLSGHTSSIAIDTATPKPKSLSNIFIPDYLGSIVRFISDTETRQLGFHVTRLPYTLIHRQAPSFICPSSFDIIMPRIFSYSAAPSHNEFVFEVPSEEVDLTELLNKFDKYWVPGNIGRNMTLC